MIVRIMGEGQLEVPPEQMQELNALDNSLLAAIDAGDEAAFRTGLSELLAAIRKSGTSLPDDFLGPSELVLPPEGATAAEVKAMLTDEGLIPD